MSQYCERLICVCGLEASSVRQSSGSGSDPNAVGYAANWQCLADAAGSGGLCRQRCE